MRPPKYRPSASLLSAASGPSSRRWHWIASVALLALVLVAYANSIQSAFVLDNKPLILLDPRVQQATAENVRQIFAHSYWWPIGEAGLHRPLTKLTFLFNYAVLGDRDQPAGYHAVNLLLHVGNILLVYLLGLRLARDRWPALVLASLWALHPVLTESVTNIAGRADLLAGMSVLGGLLLYMKSAGTVGRKRWAWLAALFVASLAGVLSKESAVMLLAVVVLYELTWRTGGREVWARAAAFAAIALPVAAAWAHRSSVLAAAGPADFPFTDNPLVQADLFTRLATAAAVMARTLGLTAWPGQLSADYSYNQILPATGSAVDWLCWLTVAAAASAAALLYRRDRPAFFMAAFAFLTYLPTSNLLMPIGTIFAERFLYVPSIGVLGCVVFSIHALAHRPGARRAAVAAALIVTICFALRTWRRNQDWRDDLSIARATAAAAPNSFKAHKGLALALQAAGNSAGRLDAAIAEIDKSVAILKPVPDRLNNAETYTIAGGLHLQQGDRLAKQNPGAALDPAAEASYRQAIVVLSRGDAILTASGRDTSTPARSVGSQGGRSNRSARLYWYLAAAHRRLNEGELAVRHARHARELAPAEPESARQLAAAYLAVRDPDRAAIALLEGFIDLPDPTLKAALVELYRGGVDQQGCAVAAGRDGPAFDPSCGVVHRHLCAASANLIERRIRTGRQDLAADLRRMALGQFGCSAGEVATAGR